ncbi:MAG: hypothetical protein ACO1O6_13765 [Bacteroidota bacterium]
MELIEYDILDFKQFVGAESSVDLNDKQRNLAIIFFLGLIALVVVGYFVSKRINSSS